MKNIILFNVLLLLSISTFSQQVSIDNIQDLGLIRNENSNESEEIKKISFNKYHSVDFKKASINDMTEVVFTRYNMYKDEMEFIKSNDIYFLKKKLGTEIKYKDEDKKYRIFYTNDELGYFVTLIQGNASLLVKENVTFTAAKPATSSYDKPKAAKFNRKDDAYFLSLDSKNTIEIPRKKKDFYKLFKNNSDKIEDFMKKNKLNHKDENDLKKIVTYYNSL